MGSLASTSKLLPLSRCDTQLFQALGIWQVTSLTSEAAAFQMEQVMLSPHIWGDRACLK